MVVVAAPTSITLKFPSIVVTPLTVVEVSDTVEAPAKAKIVAVFLEDLGGSVITDADWPRNVRSTNDGEPFTWLNVSLLMVTVWKCLIENKRPPSASGKLASSTWLPLIVTLPALLPS